MVVQETNNAVNTMSSIKRNIPEISDIQTAIKIYYRYPEIGTKEIKQLFVGKSNGTVSKLKSLARDVMMDKKIYTNRASSVNTSAAFHAWGIDIIDLEYRQKKLKDLGIM